MRAVCYARVSSKAQKDRHTVENQLRVLPDFVARQGWTLAKPARTYVDDGRSAKAGKLDAREGFARLLADAAAKAFDVVVVVDLDRLTRSEDIAERGAVLGAFQRAGVKIANATTGHVLDLSSSMGDLFSGLQAFFAAEENRKRAERVKAGKRRAIAEGRKPAGPTPYGYKYDRAAGRWSIHEEQAPIVVEIYRRVVAGESCRAIADDLSARGLQRPRGGEWTPERVWQIVTSRTYLGHWTADKSQKLRVPVPRIVDDELWSAVDAALEANGKRGLRKTRHTYLLEGIAVCEVCGGRIGIASACFNGARSNPSPATYVCANRRRPPRGAKPCKLPHRKTAEVDAAVWSELSAILMRPDLIERAVRQRAGGARADGDTWKRDIADAERRIARLAKGEEAVLARFRRGQVSEAAMDKELAAYARDRAQAQRDLDTARRGAGAAERKEGKARSLATLVATLRDQVRKATPEQRRDLACALLVGSPVVVGAARVRATVSIPETPVGQAFAPGWSTSCETNVRFRLVA